MQERQVTIEGVTHQLARPFLVLATQNPIEYEGTYPLPEAQLDRFLLRVGVRLPEQERRVGGALAADRAARGRGRAEPVVDGQTLLALQAAIEDVHVGDAVGAYIVDLVTATRTSTSTAVGASPRGSLAVLKLARCKAALAGRDFVTPEDVKAVAVPGARAPADAEARALGAAARRRGHRPRAARDRADAGCRSRRAPMRPTSEALAVAPRDGVRRPRRGLPLRRARAAAARAGRAGAARSRCRSRSGSGSRARREVRVRVDVERATALEQDELDVELTVSSETPGRAARARARRRRTGSRWCRARARSRCGSAGRTSGRSS